MSVVVRMQQCYRTVDSGQVVHIMLFSLLVYVFARIFTCIVFCSPLFHRVHQVVTRSRSVNRYYRHIWFDLKLRGLRSEIGREEIVWLDIDQSSAAQRPRERERERERESEMQRLRRRSVGVHRSIPRRLVTDHWTASDRWPRLDICPVSRTFALIRYDTRCDFNVRSKANTSQLNLPHGTDN